AERIREDVAKAQTALGTDGAEGAAGDALRWLESISESAEGGLDEAVTALGPNRSRQIYRSPHSDAAGDGPYEPGTARSSLQRFGSADP
ncbi:MAG: hypothetical protein AAGB04_26285, partial [Pseudomonadota bacterium]